MIQMLIFNEILKLNDPYYHVLYAYTKDDSQSETEKIPQKSQKLVK